MEYVHERYCIVYYMIAIYMNNVHELFEIVKPNVIRFIITSLLTGRTSRHNYETEFNDNPQKNILGQVRFWLIFNSVSGPSAVGRAPRPPGPQKLVDVPTPTHSSHLFTTCRFWSAASGLPYHFETCKNSKRCAL